MHIKEYFSNASARYMRLTHAPTLQCSAQSPNLHFKCSEMSPLCTPWKASPRWIHLPSLYCIDCLCPYIPSFDFSPQLAVALSLSIASLGF